MFIYIYSRLITVEFLAVCGVHGIISHSQFSCLFFFKPVFYICLSRTYFPCMRAVQSYCLMNPLLYILKIGKYCMALEELDLSTNRFTGPLPVTFDDLPALQVLRLMNNALTGARLFFLCCCSIFRFLWAPWCPQLLPSLHHFPLRLFESLRCVTIVNGSIATQISCLFCQEVRARFF